MPPFSCSCSPNLSNTTVRISCKLQRPIVAGYRKANTMSDPKNKLYTIAQLCARHPWLKEKAMRWLLYNADENGIGRCVIRVGRRVLIDENSFEDWLEERREVAPTRNAGAAR